MRVHLFLLLPFDFKSKRKTDKVTGPGWIPSVDSCICGLKVICHWGRKLK
jgi:hypothetical protein